MEEAPNVGVVLGEYGWSDLGTWGSLYDKLDKSGDGHVVTGATLMEEDSKGLMVAAEGQKLVVAKGLEDFIVVDTPDALLICPRSDEQWVKQMVARLKTEQGEPLSDPLHAAHRAQRRGAEADISKWYVVAIVDGWRSSCPSGLGR